MYIDHTAEPHGHVLKFQFLIQDYAPSLTLTWGASLIDFTPRLTTVGDIAACRRASGSTASRWSSSSR